MDDKLGVQIFTVRDYLNDEDQIRETFKKIKSIGYDFFQTAGKPAVSNEKYSALARECGLEICGTHESLTALAEDTQQAIENAKILETKIIGTGGYGFNGSDGTWRTRGYHNDEQLFGTIDMINGIASKIKPYGLKFTYHNHAHEFVKYGDKTVFQHFIDGTDETVSFCLDLYWAQYGGADVRKTIKDLTGRIDIIHLKDMGRDEREPFMACIGEGNMFWDGIIKESREAGVKCFVVEQDNCQDRDPFECLKRSYEYLRKL